MTLYTLSYNHVEIARGALSNIYTCTAVCVVCVQSVYGFLMFTCDDANIVGDID